MQLLTASAHVLFTRNSHALVSSVSLFEAERERETDRQTDRQRHRQTDRDRDREIQT